MITFIQATRNVWIAKDSDNEYVQTIEQKSKDEYIVFHHNEGLVEHDEFKTLDLAQQYVLDNF